MVVSCTSPTHWFVHQIADGLSDHQHNCGHFVAKRHTYFKDEFKKINIIPGSKALIFTDVLSTGIVANIMISELKKSEIKIGGLLAIVDTRTDDEKQESRRKKLLINQIKTLICLTDKPVIKHGNGDPGWILDPETLEPVPIMQKRGIKAEDSFAGIGALAFSGEAVIKKLSLSGAIKYRHYKHGSHHSEFVCDIRKILSLQDIKIMITARLNFYIEKNNFDLIIYPNHSNAYLLFNMIKRIRGSEFPLPLSQIALCSYIGNERAYLLSPKIDMIPKKILILDDGIATGSTIKSIITTLLNIYQNKIQEIHTVVFLNEMSPIKSNYWQNISGCNPETLFLKKNIKNNTKGKAFLNPAFHFTSFFSFPHQVWEKDYCPLCKQQEQFFLHTIDKTKNYYEQLFFKNWHKKISVKDIYHNMDVSLRNSDITPPPSKNTNDQKKESSDAINIIKFNLLLQKEVEIGSRIKEIGSGQFSVYYDIYCLRSILNVMDIALDEEQRKNVFYKIYDILNNPNYEYALLMLKTLIWVKPEKIPLIKFISILDACKRHLHQYLILGALMTYTRCFFAPGEHNTIWSKSELEEKLLKIDEKIDEKNKQNFELLFEWLMYGEVFNVGSSVIYLKRILFEKRHVRAYFVEDIEIICNYFEKYDDNILSDSEIPDINACAIRIIQRFDQIGKATKLIFKEKSNLLSISQSNCEQSLEKLEGIKPLIEPTLKIDSTKEAKKIFELADSKLMGLDSDWLQGNGYLQKIINPYIVSFYNHLKTVDQKVEKKHNKSHDKTKVKIDYSCFKERNKNNNDIMVIHESRILNDLLQDIVTNFWRHVVPKAINNNGFAELNFSYDLQLKGSVIIKIQDNGSGINQNESDLIKNKSIIKEFETFDCTYAHEKLNNNKGTLISLTMHTTEIM